MGSDVALIRQKIDDELHAMREGLMGLAAVAKHMTITNRYNSLGTYQQELAITMGDVEAATYVCEAYMRIVK